MLPLPDHDTEMSLLRIARDAIFALLDHAPYDPPAVESLPATSGVFVTLYVSGALRGCIGFIELSGGLLPTLAEAARRAASSDPRFMPLRKDELPNCRIEITLLGPQEAISHPDDFILGQHGLVLELHGRRGLLLPQVPVERGWSKEEFLSALCQKARVPDRSWLETEAELFRFEGRVLREEPQATA